MKQPRGKENRRLISKLFGIDEEFGFTALPTKTGTWVYRWIAAHDLAIGCPLCYMIGLYDNKHPDKRNWKRFRKSQWKQLK